MNERPNDGITSGDPLAPSSDPPRHESGLPAPEPAGQPARQDSGGYTSPPPPGAGGYGAPAVASSGRYALAGWWERVGAQLIDGLIVGIGALVILVILGSVASVGFFADDETGVGALIVGLVLWTIAITIVALLYA